jgi:hypothetical protein
MKRTRDSPATVPCGPAQGTSDARQPRSGPKPACARGISGAGWAPPVGTAALGAVGGRRPSSQSHPRPGSTALAPQPGALINTSGGQIAPLPLPLPLAARVLRLLHSETRPASEGPAQPASSAAFFWAASRRRQINGCGGCRVCRFPEARKLSAASAASSGAAQT